MSTTTKKLPSPIMDKMIEWSRILANPVGFVDRRETMLLSKDIHFDKLINKSKYTLILKYFSGSSEEIVRKIPSILGKMLTMFVIDDTASRNEKNWQDLVNHHFRDKLVTNTYKSVLRTLRSMLINGWVTLFITRKPLCLDALNDFDYFGIGTKNVWNNEIIPIENDPTYRGIFGMRKYDSR